MNRQTLTLAAALSCALALYFIAERSQQRAAETSKAEIPTALVMPSAEKPEAEDSPKVEEPVSKPDEQPSSLEVAFQPPFPDRINLFQAPRRQRSGRTEAKGQAESAVELLGFVNVDGQRVVLSIDGLVSPLAEGSEHFGIEVISIQPPTVVLQRGRQRWQASLEN